jgi:hypothetical protein
LDRAVAGKPPSEDREANLPFVFDLVGQGKILFLILASPKSSGKLSPLVATTDFWSDLVNISS